MKRRLLTGISLLALEGAAMWGGLSACSDGSNPPADVGRSEAGSGAVESDSPSEDLHRAPEDAVRASIEAVLAKNEAAFIETLAESEQQPFDDFAWGMMTGGLPSGCTLASIAFDKYLSETVAGVDFSVSCPGEQGLRKCSSYPVEREGGWYFDNTVPACHHE